MKTPSGRVAATVAGALLAGTTVLGVASVAKVGASPSKHQAVPPGRITRTGNGHPGNTHPWVGHFDGSIPPGTSDVEGMARVTDLGSVHFHVYTSLLYADHIVTVFGTQTVMTATNGETLNATGDMMEFGPLTPACHGNGLVGEANFTGGTGRFVKATGLTHFFGCIDRTVTPNHVTGISYGTISS